jgi:hypothetical protein
VAPARPVGGRSLSEGPRLPGRRRRDRRPVGRSPGSGWATSPWPRRSVPARSGSKGRRPSRPRLPDMAPAEQLCPRRAGRHHGRRAVTRLARTLPTPAQRESTNAMVPAPSGRRFSSSAWASWPWT